MTTFVRLNKIYVNADRISSFGPVYETEPDLEGTRTKVIWFNPNTSLVGEVTLDVAVEDFADSLETQGEHLVHVWRPRSERPDAS